MASAMHRNRRQRVPGLTPSFVLSLLIHVPVVALLTIIAVVPDLPKPQEQAVSVTLTVDAPTPPQPTHAEPAPLGEVTPAAVGEGMISATRLRSADVLADPRSAGVRRDLATLAPETKLEQICNLEAMEQVHLWRPELMPDFLVAYAVADTRIEGREIEADGAAIRIAGRWFRLRYACAVSADVAAVARFSFALGTEIPRGEWADLGLLPASNDMHSD